MPRFRLEIPKREKKYTTSPSLFGLYVRHLEGPTGGGETDHYFSFRGGFSNKAGKTGAQKGGKRGLQLWRGTCVRKRNQRAKNEAKWRRNQRGGQPGVRGGTGGNLKKGRKTSSLIPKGARREGHTDRRAGLRRGRNNHPPKKKKKPPPKKNHPPLLGGVCLVFVGGVLVGGVWPTPPKKKKPHTTPTPHPTPKKTPTPNPPPPPPPKWGFFFLVGVCGWGGFVGFFLKKKKVVFPTNPPHPHPPQTPTKTQQKNPPGRACQTEIEGEKSGSPNNGLTDAIGGGGGDEEVVLVPADDIGERKGRERDRFRFRGKCQ